MTFEKMKRVYQILVAALLSLSVTDISNAKPWTEEEAKAISTTEALKMARGIMGSDIMYPLAAAESDFRNCGNPDTGTRLVQQVQEQAVRTGLSLLDFKERLDMERSMCCELRKGVPIVGKCDFKAAVDHHGDVREWMEKAALMLRRSREP